MRKSNPFVMAALSHSEDVITSIIQKLEGKNISHRKGANLLLWFNLYKNRWLSCEVK